ncbi:MAG: ATP-binding protein [Sporichthyaceae bacterium]
MCSSTTPPDEWRLAPAGECMGVEIAVTDRITIAVSDSGPYVVLPPGPGGHGLAIVAAVARSWGVSENPAGKAVWFSLSLPCVHPEAPPPIDGAHRRTRPLFLVGP